MHQRKRQRSQANQSVRCGVRHSIAGLQNRCACLDSLIHFRKEVGVDNGVGIDKDIGIDVGSFSYLVEQPTQCLAFSSSFRSMSFVNRGAGEASHRSCLIAAVVCDNYYSEQTQEDNFAN